MKFFLDLKSTDVTEIQLKDKIQSSYSILQEN